MKYYGSVAALEVNNILVLNIFPENYLDFYLKQNIWDNNISISQIPNHYLEINLKDTLHTKITKKYPSILNLNQWFKLELVHNDKGNAIYYESILAEENSNINLISLEFIDGRTSIGRQLHKVFSLNNLSDASEEAISNTIKRKNYKFLAIYNVGQGNCTALCDSHGKPQLYFDLGGGYKSDSKTYPKNLELCNCDSPPIILSHWHGDHWKSVRKFPTFESSVWIVPKQKLTADALKTATEIYKKGTLLIWPTSISKIAFNSGEILRCTGKSQNDSGIALIFKQKIASIEKETLLPGDSKYKYIPYLSNKKFDNLVVTHHGGVSPSQIPLPKNTSHNAHVYSYGLMNTHGHPFPQTIQLHSQNGWLNGMDTVNGHVGIGICCEYHSNKHVKDHNTRCNTVITQGVPLIVD
ncbi:ComEC/Rec2 family competence protein [Bacillus cereus]